MPLPKYVVRLTAEARTELEDLLGAGKRAASVILHARILLEADAGANGPGWDDDRIAEAMECGASTVYRVRQAWVEEGLAAALFRKKPTGRQYRKLDGAQEARLIALACGAPPKGGRTGRCGCWPTDWWNWRLWTRSARNACARRSKKRARAGAAEAMGDPGPTIRPSRWSARTESASSGWPK
ncbi:MAG: helix-turn-helix domain-containing protein, partial [Candidatus Competibacter sp.]